VLIEPAMPVGESMSNSPHEIDHSIDHVGTGKQNAMVPKWPKMCVQTVYKAAKSALTGKSSLSRTNLIIYHLLNGREESKPRGPSKASVSFKLL